MKGKGISTRRQRIRYVVCDWLTSAVAFLLFNIYRYYAVALHTGNSLGGFLGSQKLLLEQIFVPVGMLGIYWLSGYYNRPFDKSRLQELVTTFFSAALNSLLIFLIFLIDDQTLHRTVSYEMLAVLFMLLLGCTYI
nr:sugar transferase [Muribaculaceae bacterium]